MTFKDYVILDEFDRTILTDSIDNCYKRCMDHYLKGKKMENLYEVTIVSRDVETEKLTVLVPTTTVIAMGVESAKQLALVKYATQCMTSDGSVREGLDVLVRPFC